MHTDTILAVLPGFSWPDLVEGTPEERSTAYHKRVALIEAAAQKAPWQEFVKEAVYRAYVAEMQRVVFGARPPNTESAKFEKYQAQIALIWFATPYKLDGTL